MTVDQLATARLHAPIESRRSTRAFSSAPVDRETVRLLLEAARWAPSAMNRQPWRFLVGRRGERAHALLVDALAPGNRTWAADAGLLVAALARTDEGDRPDLTAAFELGLAVAQLEVQAAASGLVSHQMGGFDADAVRTAFGVPDEWRPTVVVAVGHPGDPGLLPQHLAARESAPRVRLPVDEIAFGAGWGRPCRDSEAVQ
jgi:nitroreductase